MLKNLLTIAFRNLRKYKLYTTLNILGLAVGLSGSFLIFLFVQNELSYDRHFENEANIYRLGVEYDFSGKIDQFCNLARPVAVKMKEDYPQIVAYTRMVGLNHLTTHKAAFERQNNQIQSNQVFYADSTFFQVFDHQILAGDPATALVEPNSIVLTQTLARNIFGQEDPLGQQLRVDGGSLMTVTALLADQPGPTHMPFEALVSWSTQYQEGENDIWLGRHVYSYVLLQEGTDPTILIDGFSDFFSKYMAATFQQAGGSAKLLIQPLKTIHLDSNLTWEAYPNGNRATVRIFSVIALFLLLIAVFNYMNLALAQSETRAREVGIRKVVGAGRLSLMGQYLTESVLVAMIALVFVIGLSYIAAPYFNAILGQSISINFIKNPGYLLGLILVTVLAGLVSGIYPSMVLSRFRPAEVLKGAKIKSNQHLLRKTLVVIQFVVAVSIIIGNLFVRQQINYIQDKELGFNRENIMALEVLDTALSNKMKVLQQEMESLPGVLNSATSPNLPGEELNQTAIFVKDEKGERVPQGVQFMEVDYDFGDLIGMQVIKGRFFDEAFPTDVDQGVMINETAAKTFGWGDDPISKVIDFGENPDGSIDEVKVIGMIRDFHMGSLHNAIQPVVLFLPFRPVNKLFLKLHGQNLEQNITQIEQKWASFGSAFPLEYTFLDQSLADQYLAETKLLKLLGYFALLTIFISSLGLFGLISLSAARRKKEVSIRKILGSSIQKIFLLLSKEFILLVLLANLLAWPLAFFGIRKWLESFAYSIDINLFPFLLAAVLSVIIALATLTYHALRAAFINPVESLQYE